MDFPPEMPLRLSAIPVMAQLFTSIATFHLEIPWMDQWFMSSVPYNLAGGFEFKGFAADSSILSTASRRSSHIEVQACFLLSSFNTSKTRLPFQQNGFGSAPRASNKRMASGL